MKKRYYVAYGSNLNLEQMSRRCPYARPIGTSAIHGYELLFKGSKTGSYLTIEKKDGGIVPVAVWEVSAYDEDRLDRYEGCPAFYYKTEMVLPVKGLRSGKVTRRRCFVYIMHEDRKLGIPCSYYVSGCVQGYRSFGFDPEILYEAVDRSLEVENESGY